ncbi:MAG TPA: phosphodiester glycosidase family protein [Acidobacteriota bacterium]|nr:phosphodiester glycosidase family protein [Acidobacteriota bacterium]
MTGATEFVLNLMKKARYLLLIILLLPFLSLLLPVELPPGVSYEHVRTEKPLSVHVLRIDPKEVSIVAERALGEGVGRETVSEIGKRKGALAAINGGFFRIGGSYDGEPLGILKVGEQWFSEPTIPRGAIGWTRDAGRVVIDRVAMSWWVKVGSDSVAVDGINRPRGLNKIILYTPEFHETTMSSSSGREVIIERGLVRKIVAGGNSPIPDDGYVLSIGPQAEVDFSIFQPGKQAEVSYRFVPDDPTSSEEEFHEEWSQMDYIVGGTPLLMRNNQIIHDFSIERVESSFVEKRHPRSAIGILNDKRWVMVVVDGRQPTTSMGMSLPELALFMQSLGCTDALNLDGGGSSTLYLQGQVVSAPSDLMGERPVSDAILVIP